ncbi:helix-turn-helix domain-containing protein [Paremcibacter congregatus]|uniref:helix-turn-helix domain-containing protein n=1 Tax=Paremcibacter congregatus TaxID=2043170 RepID=UPI003C6DBDC1
MSYDDGHLQNHRINQARKRLAAGEKISNVAYDLGFSDQSHLHRLFKRLVAATPGNYQNA